MRCTTQRCRCCTKRFCWTGRATKSDLVSYRTIHRSRSASHTRSKSDHPRRNIPQPLLWLIHTDTDPSQVSHMSTHLLSVDGGLHRRESTEPLAETVAGHDTENPADRNLCGCQLYLLKPLRTSTVFSVLASTPIYHKPFDHSHCAARFAIESESDHRRYRTRASSVSEDFDSSACDSDMAAPCLRLARFVRSLYVAERAWLLPDTESTAQDDHWLSQLDFWCNCVCRLHVDGLPLQTGHIDTVLEVMKTMEYHRDPDYDAKRPRSSRFCSRPVNHHSCGLEIALEADAFSLFVDKACSGHPFFTRVSC